MGPAATRLVCHPEAAAEGSPLRSNVTGVEEMLRCAGALRAENDKGERAAAKYHRQTELPTRVGRNLMTSRTPRTYWVYIITNVPGRSGTLYVGVTNDLQRRLSEHAQRRPDSFSGRYGLTRLVYCEEFTYIDLAIDREKQIKGWLRSRKIALIESENPDWDDLSAGWFD